MADRSNDKSISRLSEDTRRRIDEIYGVISKVGAPTGKIGYGLKIELLIAILRQLEPSAWTEACGWVLNQTPERDIPGRE